MAETFKTASAGMSENADKSSPGSTEEGSEVFRQIEEQIAPKLKQRSDARAVISTVVEMESHFAGPLPPPKILAEYDAITPGAAKTIIEMATKQLAHRHVLERRQTSFPLYGLAAGAFVVTCCVIGAIYLSTLGFTVVPGLLLGTPVLAAVGWMINGRLAIGDHSRPDGDE